MNFNDALTYAENNHVPEELKTNLVLGIVYDCNDEPDDYPVCVITLGYLPDNAHNQHLKIRHGKTYAAYVYYFDIPDDDTDSDSLEYFTADTPSKLLDKLLDQLPAFTDNINYQVYTPSNASLGIELTPLLRDLFPDLPTPTDKDYKEKAVAAINKHNAGLLFE